MFKHGTALRYALLFVLAFSLRLSAQTGSANASIGGVISDLNGNHLPGATVVALHIPSGVTFGTTTRNNGKYTLPNVRVGGPYEVTVTYVGYEKQTKKVEYLALGQVLELNFSITQTSVQMGEMVVVGEKSPLLNAGKTGATTNVTKEQIEALPTINRSFQDFSKLSPLFTGSGLSAGGRNSKLNNIQLDGTQYNDLFGLGSTGTPGGQANSNPISLDAIQEFQVVIAPFDVRMGGFTGGGINAITRSGTNKIDASAYYYNRNEDLVGKSPDTKKLKLNDFSEYQTGFRIGGPIMKDKLFFFVNGELTSRREPTENALLKTYAGTANGTLLDSLATAMRKLLIDSFKYDPGTVAPFTTERPSKKLFLRFDYNISDNHNLTLRNNFVSADDDILARTSTITFDDRLYVFQNQTNSTVAQLNSRFGNNMSNELIVGYTTIRDKRSVDKAFPSLRVKTPVTGADLYAGTEEFSIANKLDQDIFEVTNNFSYYLGDHIFTLGTHNEFFSFANLFIRNFYGLYTFKNLDSLRLRKAEAFEYRYSLTGDPRQAAAFSANQFGFYAQDEWSVLPNLKVTIGARVDIPNLPDTPAKNDSVTKYFGSRGLSTDKVPSGKLLFSPRIGFNLDLFGDKSTLLRGGAGIFTGRVPYVWISNQYANTGVEFADISGKWFFVDDPNKQPKPGSAGAPSGLSTGATTEINITDPDFKMPQIFRVNVGVDQQLPWNFVGTFDFLFSKNLNDLIYEDLNIAATTATLPDGRLNFTGKRVASYFQRVMLLKNTSKGYQMNATFQVQGEPLRGFTTNAAYAFGIAKDQNSVTSSQARSQFRFNPVPNSANEPPLTTSNFETRHRVFAALSYAAEFIPNAPTTFTLYYNGQSGRPYSYIYSNDANGDGHDNNDLIYIPTYGDSKVVWGSAATALTSNTVTEAQFEAYVKRDAYLKSHRGQIAERNGSLEPWRENWDFRVSQAVNIIMGHSLEISLDIMNVANLLNSDWGWIKYVPNQSDKLLTYVGTNSAGKMVLNFTDKQDAYVKDNLFSRFQMQLGVRYSL